MNILNEVIESYNAYIEKVPNGSIYIAEQLREDNLQEALVAIKDFSEGALWLSQVSELLKKNGAIAELNIIKIEEFLIEVNKGLEMQDFVLVADMFEYEIGPFFEEAKQAKGSLQ